MERDCVYILDILESARIALSYLKGVSKEFLKNIQYQDSVIRRIELIGEDARRVSQKTQAQHPDIPWKEMIGMRNLMIHEYDDVDLLLVWETVHQNLPDLINVLEPLLPQDCK